MRIPALCIMLVGLAIALPAPARPLKLAATEAATPDALVPAGWTIESRHAGDLDGDGVDDLVLVLLQKKHAGDRDRAMLVALHHGKTWEVVATNRGMLVCYGCGGAKGGTGAPEITIKNRVLSISEFAGSREWSSSVLRFRFEVMTGHLDLIGRDSSNGDSMTGAEHDMSTDYLTGAWVGTDQPPAPDDGGPQPAQTVTKGHSPLQSLTPFEAVGPVP